MTRILLIAGTDSSGGAGLFRDQSVAQELGIDSCVAITAVTAQTDSEVLDITILPPASVSAQITAGLRSGPVAAVKIGMLANAGIVGAVCASLARHPPCPVVLDPVTHSSSGRALLDAEGQRALLAQLLPMTAVVTPNLPELAALTQAPESRDASRADRAARAAALLAMGAGAVLVKGGHDSGAQATDTLYEPRGMANFSAPRQNAGKRGTGCTLATAIACYLAKGMPLRPAVGAAKNFTNSWIAGTQ